MEATDAREGGSEPLDRESLPVNEPRGRILEAAYALFSHHGIHAVGIDRIIAEADVAKATLYHHFASKEALVVAFLDLRQERWTYGWLKPAAERLATDPHGRALAVFDAFDEWFRCPDFEGCSFISTMLEINDRDSPVYNEAVRHLAVIRGMLEGFLRQAGALDAEEASYQLQILLMGSIVSASRGDLDAARRARPLAASLLSNSR
jgi:AcrR family transcriptional regulator